MTDPSGGGFVMAPSPRQASTAGVLRAAWRAHGGPSGGALAPFATGLTSTAVRRALTIADGMRNGQQLGALLGYLLERGIHDASGVGGIEIDWVVFELRRQYPLKVDTIDNAPQASAERLVADGWKLAQVETKTPGAVVAAIPAPTGAGQPTFGPAEKNALQAVIADVVAALDAFADLGLAESMYQLAGANLERAAAATDMIGRASAPPDMFEAAATPRGGRGIEQRLVVTFGTGARPAGYASDTPRARLAPAADAFVARRLGALDGIRVRLLDASGAQIAAPTLASLGLSALDLAALDLSSENVTLSSVESPETMPGAPNSNPGRQGVARLLLAAGQPGAVTVGFDLTLDAALLDLLDHAAAWQHALAGRKPLTAETFLARAQLDSAADTSGLAATVASLAQELGAAPPAALKAWGIGGPDATAARAPPTLASPPQRRFPIRSRRRACSSAVPPSSKDRSISLPPDIRTTVGDQKPVLGPRKGVLARWLQDSARVRPAAASLGDALLRDDLAASAPVHSWAAQSPAAPYVPDRRRRVRARLGRVAVPGGARRRSGHQRRHRRRRCQRRSDRHRAGCLDRGHPRSRRDGRGNREPHRARRARAQPDPARGATRHQQALDAGVAAVRRRRGAGAGRLPNGRSRRHATGPRAVAGGLPRRIRRERPRHPALPERREHVPGPLGREGDDMTAVYSLTRVEPVSRGGDPGRGLAATVQDPFWMLARQRQFGELTGEDAGSPVQVAFVQKEARFDGWKPESGAVLPYSPQTDVVEALVAGEAAGPAHSTLDRVQAGRALAAAVSKSVARQAARGLSGARRARRAENPGAVGCPVRRRARRRRRDRRRGRRRRTRSSAPR